MSKSMLKSIHRRALGITADDQVMARSGYVAGGDDKPAIFFPSPTTVALFDEFLGDLIADEWASVKGDTGLTGATIANITNGVVRLTGSETIATAAPESCGALTQGLVKQWKVNMGGPKGSRLRMSARVKAPISTTAEEGRHHLFVGFSDSGGAEMPVYDTGGGVISQAADAVGFIYSPTGATTDRWTCVSAKSTAGDSGDQQVIPSTAVGPTTNVYDWLEVEVKNGSSDTGSLARFWVNGKPVGTINSPVGSAIALTPWIGGFVQDTGYALAIDIDAIGISSPRDTGE